MLEINQFLKKETKEFKRKTIKLNTDINNKKLAEEKKKLQERFDQWIIALKELFSNKLYRQILREIEEKKYIYKILSSTEFWKLKLLKVKSILKIVRIKMSKHQKDVFLENSTQNLSLKFWFNQIFITLEELCLEFRFDLNPHLNPSSKELFISIQTLAEAHMEFIYYLCLFSINTGEVMPLLSYISDSEQLMHYANLLMNPDIYNLFLDVLLIKIKLLLQNCNYIPALDSLQNFFKLFFKNIIFFLDYNSQITSESLSKPRKKDKRRVMGLCGIIQKLIMAYYLRGVVSEHLGFYKNSIKAYQQCRWFSNIFMPNFNKPVFKYFRNMEKTYILYDAVFKDIQEKFDNKNNKNKQDRKSKSKRFLYLKKGSLNKSMENIGYKNLKTMKNKNNYKLRNNSSASRMSKKQLVKELNKIGHNLYKEEENRSNSVFNKYGPNNFVLSTVDMVNNLLSKPFRKILRQMDKVEITKPKEEINFLINKTLTIKRRNEFKAEMEKSSSIKSKKNTHAFHRNKSISEYLSSTINQPVKIYNRSTKLRIKLATHQTKNNEKSKENNRYEYNSTNGTRSKYLYSTIKTNGLKYKNKSTIGSFNKINKYSPDKDVFSKSLVCKKKYLDSFFEKELVFQKKLLKLKNFDTEKISTEDYNQQQVLKSAEQDFDIIKCFAESKNAKKNLINLVGENELKNWETMVKNKTGIRTTRKNMVNLDSLNTFMKLNHISQKRLKYDPDNYAKNNDEKAKILTMECANLEEMQNRIQMQKEKLRNQILGIKSKNANIYKIN